MPHLDRKGLIAGLLTIIGLAVIAFVFMHGKARAATVCDLEASVGVGLSQNTLSASKIGSVDLGGVGALGGLGAGCDLQSKLFVFGVMGRASLMEVKGGASASDLASGSMKSTELFEGAFRAGFRVHEKTTVYGLAGWSWEDLQTTGLGTKHPNGLLLGAGVDFSLASIVPGMYSRFEYTWHNFQHESISVLDGPTVKIEPNLNVVRAALVYKFNDPIPGPVFEDDKPIKRRKVCDPKLANC